MQEHDIEEAVRLVSVTMNQTEGRWARKTMQFHFQCERHQITDGRAYYIWKAEGQIKGLVGLHHYIWGPKENVWLAWFAVHPDCQRQGRGRKLLNAMERIAVGLGYQKFLVETYKHSDFDKARSFYEANAFREIGVISDYLPDGSAMVVYAKKIGSGEKSR